MKIKLDKKNECIVQNQHLQRLMLVEISRRQFKQIGRSILT